MPSSQPRPKLAVLVANHITGDSRVQKIALSAAGDGWDVTLIGRSRSDEVERSTFGPVQIIRVPVEKELAEAERARRQQARARRSALAARDYGSAEQARLAHEAKARERAALIGDLMADRRRLAQVPRFARRVWSKATRVGFQGSLRAYEWIEEHGDDLEAPVGDWRRDHPALLDLERAFGPVIERLRPDVIHANDITMLNTAAISAGRLRASGHDVKWVYDAHEYVAGVDWPTPRMMSAFPDLEKQFIHRADAVTTVSPEIAEVIQQDHKLPTIPLVVRNTPVASAVGGTSDVSVRAAAELGDDVPLMVYSGYIHAERGLDTAIDALPLLPEVHLVIVAGGTSPTLRKLRRRAANLEVGERVHVVPYVAQHEVADYLSTADVGIICSKRTINYELSLPTKLAEYLHAGLPVLCSDVETLSAFVRQHQVGKVFTGGEPESFVAGLRALLAERDQTARNISPEVLTELSWEHQGTVFLRLYRELSGLQPPPPETELNWNVEEKFQPQPRGKRSLPWRKLTATPIKLGLGPANYAGQLATLATAITDAREDVSAEVFMHKSSRSFGYPADVVVPRRSFRRLEPRIDEARRILPRYTHLIADGFVPAFGGLNGPTIAGDLPALLNRGISVALLSHGSDIRDPRRHMETHEFSHYRYAPSDFLEQMIEISAWNRATAESSGLPVFVTTPDLLDDVPSATWSPLVVDLDRWASDQPVMERARPVVLHAPSKRWTKGTDLFIESLEELDSRGLIELRLAEGLPWRKMREEVQGADIVVDQFSVGSYGAFACEAMAAGRPVVAYLDEHLSDAIGEQPPIVNTRADQVATAIEELLDDRDRAVKLGAEAVAYVRKYHDGTRSALAFNDFLLPGDC